ncbi:MAG: nucleoside deaminase [Oscillospiraceae bacterium]|nr:nucleoside deaminase [Oscillospiraceae bacterium]
MKNPEEYMHLALQLAGEAGKRGETPVGCVITDKAGTVIGRGSNRREEQKSALAHAEMEAISEACRALGDWRLDACTIYVTLEPCPMCAGALIMARAGRVYYGARENASGSCGSVLNLFMEPYGHKTQITGGILAEECAALLTDFFAQLR